MSDVPRCALFDNPPSALTIVQKEISKHGWRPSAKGKNRDIWDARYQALISIEQAIAAMIEQEGEG
jgi:hypothetical protein